MGDNGVIQAAQGLEEKAINVEYEEYRRAAMQGGAPGPVYVPREPIEQKYRGKIVPLFEPFTRMPEPGSYDAPIQALKDAMQQLSNGQQEDPINGGFIRANPDLDHVHSATSNLEDWSGAAADNFKRNFLDKFTSISQNQFLLLGAMRGALEADQKRWEYASRDIKHLVQTTNDGLDNVLSSGKNGVPFFFSVASAVAAIGSVFTAGASSAVIPAVGAAGAVGTASMDGAKLAKEGGTTERVVQSMKEALDRLTQEIQNSGGKIARALNEIPAQVQQYKADFVSPRPALAGMQGDAATSDQGVGRVY